MKRLLLSIFFIGLALTIASWPAVARADNLEVLFETGSPPAPLFGQANFLPGDSVTRWAKVIQRTGSAQSIAARLNNYTDPDGLGDYFEVDIRVHGAANPTFSGTMTQLHAAGTVVLNSALASDVWEQYDFTVTFKSSAGNPFQNKTLSFDFVIGLMGQQTECADCGGGPVTTFSTGGGGGGGSFNPEDTGGIAGVKFNDINGNGARDAGEPGLIGWIIYLDVNGNRTLDLGEKSVLTAADGSYVFSNLPPGTYTVREVSQDNWTQTYPGIAGENQHIITVNTAIVTGVNFGNIQGQVAGIAIGPEPAVAGAETSLPRTGLPAAVVMIAGLVGLSLPWWRRKA